MGNSMIRCTAVMLAAGMGLRMGTDTRKQYLMLGGMPMFLHSIRTMQESEYITDIIVMAHRDDLEVVREFLEEYGFTKKLRKIAVGATLFRLFETVQTTKACCAGVPAKDTVKVVDENCDVKTTPNRADVWIVQTPQVFSFELIRDAHRKALAQEEYLSSQGIVLTDDSMVAELAGNCKVRMVMATYRNIKITTPEDLVIGDAFLKA